jgi:hypothetical protein
MCDDLLEWYALRINAIQSDTDDLVPSVLFFSAADCSGYMWPNDCRGDFPTGISGDCKENVAFSVGTKTTFPPGFTPLSVFVPFHTHHILLTDSVHGTKLDLMGPFVVSDLTTYSSLAPTDFTVLDASDWTTVVLPSACVGNTKYIGRTPLVRYQPQSSRCDVIVTQLCQQPNGNPLCGCFADLVDIEARSQVLGVSMPVTCFGPRCSAGIAYRTAAMVGETCNLTICKQTIVSTPGVIQDGSYTIYCGGRFFDKQGNLIQPVASVEEVAPSSSSNSSTASVWVPYIVVGVGMLICLILVFLIFSPKPRMSMDATFSQLQLLEKTG